MGVFAVKFEVENGSVVAKLTGEHFTDDESDASQAVVREGVRLETLKGGSPVYLVRDSVVDVAVRIAERSSSRSTLYECHSGSRGRPCGVCEKCLAMRRESFTRAVIGHIELPECAFAKRVFRTVQSTIGMVWTESPFCDEMREDEVTRIFKKMGVVPRKEDGHETHKDGK